MNKIVKTINGQRYVYVSPRDFRDITTKVARKATANLPLHHGYFNHSSFGTHYQRERMVNVVEFWSPRELHFFLDREKIVVVSASDWVQ